MYCDSLDDTDPISPAPGNGSIDRTIDVYGKRFEQINQEGF